MSQNDRDARAQQPPAVDSQNVTEVRPLGLDAVKVTDVGRLRPHNEDYVDFYIPPDPQQRATKGAIYLVADGMGGHQAGEVASQGAVEVAIGHYYRDTTHDIGTSLVRAFRAANQQIYDQAQADSSKAGMGTTLVAAVVLGRKVYVANVGDSRAYLINKQGISQITEDHSWVDEQVRAGLLTPEQARRHPQRNLVTRALGSRPAVEVDLFEGEIGEGDILLLCTDGLTGPVEDKEIAAIIQAHPPEEALKMLVDQANERGGSDNVTVLLVSAGHKLPAAVPAPPPAAKEKPARRSLLIPALAGLAAILVLVLAGLIGSRLLTGGTPTPSPTLTLAATDTALPPMPTPAPTETPAGDATPTTETAGQPTEGTPLPTGEGTPAEPTATLAPTYSPTPTQGTTDTPQPTNTPATPAPPSPRDPEPVLIEPTDGGQFRGAVRFRWSYDNHPALPSHKQFQVLIWQEGDAQHNGAANYTRQLEQIINLDNVPRVRDGGPGNYWWSVVVVDTRTNTRTSREAPPRLWTYLPPPVVETATPKPTLTEGASKDDDG